MRVIGSEIFDSDVTMNVLDTTQEDMGNGNMQDHVTFDVKVTSKTKSKKQSVLNDNKVIMSSSSQKFNPWFPNDLHLNVTAFCKALPYHIIFDEKLSILQTGVNIQRLCPGIKRGDSLDCHFALVYPSVSLKFTNLLAFMNAVFMLRVKRGGIQSSKLTLKGVISFFFFFFYQYKFF